MGKFFNTAGPCVSRIHYMLDPLVRLSSVKRLVDAEKYFILHAPRQTGKTTTMLSFMEALNQEGKCIALYANVEAAQAVRQDVEAANRVFVSVIENSARVYLPADYHPSAEIVQAAVGENALHSFLSRWCAELPKPLVLFLDEADALIGDSLLSLLRQLRSGYPQRPSHFPQSVTLIGLRDFRDYRIYSEKSKRYEIGGSAFNIRDESLTLSNFTPAEVNALYAQHTAETGQAFTPDALDLIFEQTQGQPWLVNALGRELCFGQHQVPGQRTVTAEDVRNAVEILILRRDVHLDHLSDKLTEPRVARIIDMLLSGQQAAGLTSLPADDLNYVLDLGLVARSPVGLKIANPIYQEVIPRELTAVQQEFFPANPAWYVRHDGKLDIDKVLQAFYDFYRENAEILLSGDIYQESVHHLMFMAWLQRIVNGGGFIRREYAAGRGFIDLVILFAGEKFVFELKTEGNFRREKALEQVHAYATRMGVEEAYLMVFRKKVSDPALVGLGEILFHEGLKVHLVWV